MVKRILLISLLIAVAVFTVYLILPSQKLGKETYASSCTPSAVDRLILDRTKWNRWWPGNIEDSSISTYKDYKYRIDQIQVDGFAATVYNNDDSAKLLLQVSPTGTDSTVFTWYTEVITTPFASILSSKPIVLNIDSFINAVNSFFNNDKNIYGLDISMQKVKDSSLISIKSEFGHYPFTEEVYALVESLEQYIKQHQGLATGAPMLNVYQEGPTYFTMVAIPTERDLPSEEKFQLKKMVLGNILKAEVKGGIATIRNAEEQLDNYVKDHRKASPAIPYQSLVTNRLQEQDTAKWITYLYYPVFY
jgi:hypothetical protein